MTAETSTADRDPEQLTALLIQAAGNADAVRLAALAFELNSAGVDTFTRGYLIDAWSQRWRHHVAAPGPRRPAQRVARALPVLIGVTALAAVGGPDVKVSDADILQFLADRGYLAEALDVQQPMSNDLPVGDATRAAAAALVAGSVDAAAAGEGGMAAAGDRSTTGVPPGELGGVMTLHVEAEVIKGGDG